MIIPMIAIIFVVRRIRNERRSDRNLWLSSPINIDHDLILIFGQSTKKHFTGSTSRVSSISWENFSSFSICLFCKIFNKYSVLNKITNKFLLYGFSNNLLFWNCWYSIFFFSFFTWNFFMIFLWSVSKWWSYTTNIKHKC